MEPQGNPEFMEPARDASCQLCYLPASSRYNLQCILNKLGLSTHDSQQDCVKRGTDSLPAIHG